MHNRWCIIAGARSGSTWFENLIHESSNSTDKMILGEYISPYPYTQHFTLDEHNNIISMFVEEPINFLQENTDRIQMILNSNIEQSLTIRTFVRPNEHPIFKRTSDYIDFFQKLAERNFKFVSLYRNIFDRSISGYFMAQTGNIHRWYTDVDNGYYITNEGVKDWSRVCIPDPIIVDIPSWESILWSSYQDEIQRKKVTAILNCPTVHYETLLEDCDVANIDVSPSSIIKTYDISYKDYILNYDELVDKYNYYKDMVGYED